MQNICRQHNSCLYEFQNQISSQEKYLNAFEKYSFVLQFLQCSQQSLPSSRHGTVQTWLCYGFHWRHCLKDKPEMMLRKILRFLKDFHLMWEHKVRFPSVSDSHLFQDAWIESPWLRWRRTQWSHPLPRYKAHCGSILHCHNWCLRPIPQKHQLHPLLSLFCKKHKKVWVRFKLTCKTETLQTARFFLDGLSNC